MKKFAYLFLAGTALIFSSCSKDDPSKKEMLTDKNWVMTAATIDPSITLISGGTTNNLYNQTPACVKDNITRFSSDGKASFDEGATKCDIGDPQTITGTWTLSIDEKTVSTTESGDVTSITITSLTNSKFQGKYQATIGADVYTIDATWEAK